MPLLVIDGGVRDALLCVSRQSATDHTRDPHAANDSMRMTRWVTCAVS